VDAVTHPCFWASLAFCVLSQVRTAALSKGYIVGLNMQTPLNAFADRAYVVCYSLSPQALERPAIDTPAVNSAEGFSLCAKTQNTPVGINAVDICEDLSIFCPKHLQNTTKCGNVSNVGRDSSVPSISGLSNRNGRPTLNSMPLSEISTEYPRVIPAKRKRESSTRLLASASVFGLGRCCFRRKIILDFTCALD
jgi:hypothetical protein